MPILSGIPNIDKVVHFSLYAVQAFLLYRAFSWPGRPRFSLARVLALVGLMAVWGAADEVHQNWIPGRTCDADDLAADVAGASAGALISSALSARRKQVVGGRT